MQRVVGESIKQAKQEKWTPDQLKDQLKKKLAAVIPATPEALDEIVETVMHESKSDLKDREISKKIEASLVGNNEELEKIQFLKSIQEKDLKIKELNQKLEKIKIDLATAKDMAQIGGKSPKIVDNKPDSIKVKGVKQNEEEDVTIIKSTAENNKDEVLKVSTLEQLTADQLTEDMTKSKGLLSAGSELIAKLEAGKALTEFEIENLKRLAQEGITSNETAQNAVMELKKLKSASEGQSALMTKELEIAKHAVRSREVMLIKVKEGFTHALDKKDTQIKQIKERSESLILKAQVQGQELSDNILKFKKMKEDRDYYLKQVEISKSKISQLEKGINKNEKLKTSGIEEAELKKVTIELERAKQDKIQTIQKLSIMGQDKISLEKKVKALEFQLKSRGIEIPNANTNESMTTQIAKAENGDSLKDEKYSVLVAENEKLKLSIKTIQQKMLEERNQSNARDVKRLKDDLEEKNIAQVKTSSLDSEELKQKISLLEAELQNVRQKDAHKLEVNSSQLAKERVGHAKDQEKALLALQDKQEAINKLKEVESRVMEKEAEIKTLDHKLKLALKQIETMEKNSKKQNTKGKPGEEGDSGLDAKTKHLIKQLELKKEKADSDLAKTHTEMAEVKKEMAAQKSENMSMKNKIQQLEREVAKHKKAS